MTALRLLAHAISLPTSWWVLALGGVIVFAVALGHAMYQLDGPAPEAPVVEEVA